MAIAPVSGGFDGCVDAGGKLRVYGWAKDRRAPDQKVRIDVYVGGPAGSDAPCYHTWANKERSDVGWYAFDETFDVGVTGHTGVYVYGIWTNGENFTTLGQKEVTLSAPVTPADTTPPTITRTEIVDDGTNAVVAELDIEDDEALNLGALGTCDGVKTLIDGEYRYAVLDACFEDAQVIASTDRTATVRMTFNYSSKFANHGFPGAEHRASFTARDAAGNVSQPVTLDFHYEPGPFTHMAVGDSLSSEQVFGSSFGYQYNVVYDKNGVLGVHTPSGSDSNDAYGFTALKPGKCVVEFVHNKQGDIHFMTFVVDEQKQDQVIAATARYDKKVGDAAFALDARVTTGDGKLSYASDNEAVARVDASGRVTVVSAGTATITVTAAGTDSFNAASTTVVVVVKAAQAPKPTSPAKVNIATKSVRLASASVVFSGVAAKPRVLVDGLREGTDFTVSYANNAAIGTATVTVTGKGNYTGSQKLTFRIVPGKAAIKKAKAGSKCVALQIKAQKGGVKYQVSYRTGKGKWQTVAAKKTKLTIKKLKGGKKYQVRVRAFKKVGGKVYYGAWSKAKTVKVKK